MAKQGAFISYARADGEAFATGLRERLAREAPDFHVWQDRPEIEGGIGWWRQIEEALERVEFLVIVMTPAVLASEITRKEWRAARQSGVCVYPVQGPGFRFDDPRLPRWMARVHVYDLATQWPTFLAHLRRGCQAARVPFMAPPLSTAYVGRPREAEALRAQLLDPASGDGRAVTAVLSGAGGFGKTTLAAALCHDDAVVTAFDDGVLWATLGQTPNVQGELTRLYAALTGERPGFISVEDAAQALAEKLEHKRCLIVVDDAWDVAHLRPSLRGGPACARLVTTRQAAVAAEGHRIAVEAMAPAEAVALLVARLPEAPADLQALRTLAERLGEWPLLLRLAGAALRQRLDRGDTLDGALRHVAKALDKRGVTAFDRERPTDRHEAVASTLAMSLDLLDPTLRTRCADLALFAEDVAIPAAVLGELWGLDDFDTEEALSRLHDASLLEFDLGRGTVHVHDVMRLCYAELLGADTAAAHARLLAAWPDLHHLPHRYAWSWVGHHLLGAARGEVLSGLLHDLHWLRAKLEATDIYALLADFARRAEDADLQPLLGVLRLASHVLAGDRTQLATQLLARVADPVHSLGLQGELRPADGSAWLRPMVPSLVGPGGALVRTLECPGTPSALALTPDGRWIIAGTDEGLLTVWELSTGTCVRTLRPGVAGTLPGGLAAGSRGLDFAMRPDGQVLLTGPLGLALWNPLDDAPPQVLAHLADPVAAIAIGRDGRLALLGTRKGQLTLHDAESGACQALYAAGPMDIDTGQDQPQAAHRLGIAAVAISGDGCLGLTGSHDKTVRLWDLPGHRLLGTLQPAHEGTVHAVATAAGRPLAVSASADRTLRVWDLDTHACLATVRGHAHRVYDVAVSTDGTWAISASHDRTLRVWDLATGQRRQTLDGHSDAVLAVALVPGERQAVSAARDGTLRVWQLQVAQARSATQAHEGGIHAVALVEGGRVAFTAGQDHRLRLWDTASAQVVQALSGHHDTVSALAVHEGRGWAVTGSHDRTVVLWDYRARRSMKTLKGHADAVTALCIAPGGAQALSAGADGDVIVWDLLHGRMLRRWSAHRRGIAFAVVEGGWQHLLTGSLDGTVRRWDLATGAALDTLRAHGDAVTAGALSPDGNQLLTGGADGLIRLWSLPGLDLLHTAHGHAGKVRSLAFADEGARACSGGYDRYLRCWSLPGLTPLAAFAADAALSGVACAGPWVVAGDAQGCTHFLQLQAAALLPSIAAL